jgi:hypothetical protein
MRAITIPLTHGVMTPSIIVGRVLLPTDELFRVEQLAVGPSSNLVYNGGLQVDEHSSEVLKTLIVVNETKPDSFSFPSKSDLKSEK